LQQRAVSQEGDEMTPDGFPECSQSCFQDKE
jgi:hypothetical protein